MADPRYPERKPPDDPAIARAAAQWWARQDAGLSPAEEAEFLQWLEADERHAACFEQMDATGRILDRAPELPPLREGKGRPWRAAPEAEPLRFRRTAWWGSLAGLAAAVVLGFLWLEPRLSSPGGSGAVVLTAPRDVEFRRVNLPDGSTARLRAGAECRVEYSAARRNVQLVSGEAFFTVAPDPARPFVVEARGVAVRAVGTAFHVDARTSDLEVLVTEGKVRIEDHAGNEGRGASVLPPPAEGNEPLLIAGQKAIIATATGSPRAAVISRLSTASVSAALTWHERTLAFDAAPLEEVVSRLNRYNQHQLVIADPALAGRKVAGSFRADDPEGFVALLTAGADIAAERRGDATLLRRRR